MHEIREELNLLSFRISVRTGLRPSSSNSPRSVFPSNLYPHVLRCQANSLGRAYPIHYQNPGRFLFTLHSYIHPCIHVDYLRSARFLSSSSIQKGPLPPESIKARYVFNFTVSPRVDFVQGLYLNELKVYKPAPKAPRPMSSPVSHSQHSFSAFSFSSGCQ